MTSDGPSVERLRDYLRTVKPAARARAVLRGEQDPGSELVLQKLRRSIREAGQPAVRIGDAARLFFAPLEPFLVDDAADHKRLGLLAHVSLEPIGQCIGRDLMPAETEALSEDINRALLENDRGKTEQLTRALHDRSLSRIKETVAAVGGDDKVSRRLAVQVGTPRALDDLGTVAAVLAWRDVLADLSRRLPDHPRSFEREQIDPVKSLLDSAAASKAPGLATTNKADLFFYGFILVMGRLASPWQLIRIATYAAESDDAVCIPETPYAVAVTIVMGEVGISPDVSAAGGAQPQRRSAQLPRGCSHCGRNDAVMM